MFKKLFSKIVFTLFLRWFVGEEGRVTIYGPRDENGIALSAIPLNGKGELDFE